jgi:tRNA pseudouridine55 synthase
MDGLILIDKEKDITSYDVIRKLKKLLPRKYKIGHAGTLDPFATGLLIVMLGKATKLMDEIHKLEKRYEVKAEFGFATDTQDITGERIKEIDVSVNILKEKIEGCIKESFLGNISQLPPIYSAKKVNGQKAYDLARKGKEVILKPKEIEVKNFEIVEYDWPYVKFSITCSTGTYVRTLIDDLGKSLDSLATAIELRRISIGSFELEDAVRSEEISNEDFRIEDRYLEIDKVKEILKNE